MSEAWNPPSNIGGNVYQPAKSLVRLFAHKQIVCEYIAESLLTLTCGDYKRAYDICIDPTTEERRRALAKAWKIAPREADYVIWDRYYKRRKA